MAELIKVHVTAEQREELELLINHRLNDIKLMVQHGRVSAREHNSLGHELDLLIQIKDELQQAGT